METTLYEYVLAQLQAHKGRWSEVSRATGISKRTIEKIARREVADPRISNVQALATYFRDRATPTLAQPSADGRAA